MKGKVAEKNETVIQAFDDSPGDEDLWWQQIFTDEGDSKFDLEVPIPTTKGHKMQAHTQERGAFRVRTVQLLLDKSMRHSMDTRTFNKIRSECTKLVCLFHLLRVLNVLVKSRRASFHAHRAVALALKLLLKATEEEDSTEGELELRCNC